MRLPKPSALAAVATILALPVLAARAETTQCTPITSLPAVITVQGIYCLNDDLSTPMTTGPAIEIQANNVTIDFNGHRLGNSGGPGNTASGIYAYKRENVTIRNGTVRNFYYAVQLRDASPASTTGYVVEDMRIDHATFEGILVGGRGALVRRNQILFTGGTTANGANVAPAGIVVSGPANRVLDNDIVTITSEGIGTSRGIIIGGGGAGDAGTLVVGNRITGSTRGIDFADFGGTGKYRDTLTRDVTVPYYGGTDAGHNN
jgi:hypothetical protein